MRLCGFKSHLLHQKEDLGKCLSLLFCAVKTLNHSRINEMSEEDYAQYLRYHFYICEKPEMIGMSNHLLFVGEKDS